MICNFCKKEFKSLAGLHGHVKKIHNCSQEEYYHTFEPRYDKQTGELIHYKDYKHYFATDFNDRESFAAWLAENRSLESTREYCLEKIKERAERKGQNVLPSQVCLKTVFLPSILGLEKIFGGAENVKAQLEKIGVKLPYHYMIHPTIDNNEVVILQDTREQYPLNFPNKKLVKLSVGDYTVEGKNFKNVYVERKSLNDLAGTLGNGHERFMAELERARTLGAYIVVVVEDTLNNMMAHSPRSNYGKRITGAHIAHEIRDLSSQFDVQFLFAGSRTRAADLIQKIFKIKEDVRLLDLEYLKDGGLI